MKKRSSNIMTLRIKVCLLMMCSMCMILAGCSSEDDGGAVAPLENNGATARMDSISYLPGDPAVFKFNYDSEYKVKNYWMEQGWSNYFGADSVVFSYQPDKIVATMSFLDEVGFGMRDKQKTTATFYLHGGRIVGASIPIDNRENMRDSIVYHYNAGRLANYDVYERGIRDDSESSAFFCYTQNLKWQGDDLISMTAVKDSETLYETSFTYSSHTLTALLPYMSFEYLLDSKRTYMSVLANMGYFGVLPQHELTDILIIKMRDVKQKYQLQIDYQYGSNGLPSGYDYHYWNWYWGQPFFSEQEANEQWNLSESRKIEGFRICWKEK